MRVLFVMRSPGYLRNHEATVRELSAQGHKILLAFDQPDQVAGGSLVESVAQNVSNVSYCWTPRRPVDMWSLCAGMVRSYQDYLRYLHPRYQGAPKLKARAEKRLRGRMPLLRSYRSNQPPAWEQLIQGFLATCERGIPVPQVILDWMREVNPDVVLITPLVDFGSKQVDYVKAAKVLRIPSALVVQSWDNLTNKGLIRLPPDRVIVWNTYQKNEAVQMHQISPGSIDVVGAPAYDHWFGREPSSTRSEFCAKVGLTPDRPFFLYLGSSPFIGPNEVAFVKRWLRALRNCDEERLRHSGLLIRPHPQNHEQWRAFPVSSFDNVAVYPHGGANPVDRESKNDYFDSIYYSAGVIGVNTSAMIEAGIVGRPVFTVLDPSFQDTQMGTLHFQYLLQAGGGLVHVAQGVDENLSQLGRVLAMSPDEFDRKSASFVEEFIRPMGPLNIPAKTCVRAIERIAEHQGHGASAVKVDNRIATRLFLYMSYVLAKSVDSVRNPPPRKTARTHRYASSMSQKARKRHNSAGMKNRSVSSIVGQAHAIARDGSAVIFGPWLGSHSVERIFWVPFVKWFSSNGLIRKDQVIAIDYMGLQEWYEDCADRVVPAADFGTTPILEPAPSVIATLKGAHLEIPREFEEAIVGGLSHYTGGREPVWIKPRDVLSQFSTEPLEIRAWTILGDLVAGNEKGSRFRELSARGPPEKPIAISFEGIAEKRIHNILSDIHNALVQNGSVEVLGGPIEPFALYDAPKDARNSRKTRDGFVRDIATLSRIGMVFGPLNDHTLLAPLYGAASVIIADEISDGVRTLLTNVRRLSHQVGGEAILCKTPGEIRHLWAMAGGTASRSDLLSPLSKDEEHVVDFVRAAWQGRNIDV